MKKMVMFLLALLLGGAFFWADYSAQSQTVTLKLSEWECTGTRLEGKVSRSGNANLANTTYKEVCVEYTRKSEVRGKPKNYNGSE